MVALKTSNTSLDVRARRGSSRRGAIAGTRRGRAPAPAEGDQRLSSGGGRGRGEGIEARHVRQGEGEREHHHVDGDLDRCLEPLQPAEHVPALPRKPVAAGRGGRRSRPPPSGEWHRGRLLREAALRGSGPAPGRSRARRPRTVRAASTSASGVGASKNRPVSGVRVSSAPPRARAMTGRPEAWASSGAMPKSSSPGKTSARALRYSPGTSASGTLPSQRTCGGSPSRSSRASCPCRRSTAAAPFGGRPRPRCRPACRERRRRARGSSRPCAAGASAGRLDAEALEIHGRVDDVRLAAPEAGRSAAPCAGCWPPARRDRRRSAVPAPGARAARRSGEAHGRLARPGPK